MSDLVNLRNGANAIIKKQRELGYHSKSIHIYKNEAGEILFARLRMSEPDGTKWIRPLSKNSQGQWSHFKEPAFNNRKPIYNLHLLSRNLSDKVYVVEGEKCAKALSRIGLLATTSGGATSAKDANWDALKGRNVIIWPDNDESGIKYSNEVERLLLKIDATVSRIDVSKLGLTEKQDCFDWLIKFESNHDKLASKEDIEALVTNSAQASNVIENPYKDTIGIDVKLTRASTVSIKPIDWLWNGWIARGKFNVLAGQAGTGKTTIALSIASTITNGGMFPDGSKSPIGSVLIWSGEDGISDTLIPRLIAVGANLEKVHFLDDVIADFENRSFNPATDMQGLLFKAYEIEDLALLILDPIVNAVTGDGNSNNNVRQSLQPIVDFAEKLNCAVIGITHFNKGSQGKDPLERVTGSLAYGALARVVLAAAKITDGDESKRIFCRTKNNLGLDTGGFEFELDQKTVQDGINASYTSWGQALEGNAIDLIGTSENHQTSDCVSYLEELLAGGRMPVNEILRDGSNCGFSKDQLHRAKTKLQIKSHRDGFGRDSVYYWDLPPITNSLSGNIDTKNIMDCMDSGQNNVQSMQSIYETPLRIIQS